MLIFLLKEWKFIINNYLELSDYRFARAEEDLKSARILFENFLYKQAVNRSYYAVFHATRAILALDNFDSKKHSGIIAYFNQNYIATGRIESKYSKILMSAQKVRNNSDYDDFYVINKEEVATQLSNAALFLQRVEKFLIKL